MPLAERLPHIYRLTSYRFHSDRFQPNSHLKFKNESEPIRVFLHSLYHTLLHPLPRHAPPQPLPQLYQPLWPPPSSPTTVIDDPTPPPANLVPT